MNTYTVTSMGERITVEGAALATEVQTGRQFLVVWRDEDKTSAAAIFKDWSHVTVERGEDESTAEATPDAPDWQEIAAHLWAIDSSPDARASLIIRALQEAVTYVLHHGANGETAS